jgi:uncharacterized repeat protein (TIGR02543 family)
MKKNYQKKILAIALLILLITTTSFPLVLSQQHTQQTTPERDNLNWWNTQWPYRKLITIDHTYVTSPLTNFPLLISQPNDPDIAAAAQSTGQDIVFIQYTDNTTKLNHEIEYYNHVTGQLVTWVRLPTLSSTTDTKLWIYYGNPTSSPQENIPGTWDTTYTMVQHLNETGSAMEDSTIYQNDGVSTGTNHTDAGKIDGSQLYNGNDKIVINNFINSPTALTFETWVYRDATAFIYIACKGTYSNQNDWILYLRNNQPANEGIDFGIRNHTAYLRAGDTPVNTWFYLTATYDNGNVALYLDGNAIATASGWPTLTNVFPHLGVGNDYNGTEGGLYPMTLVMLDEIRISNTARSSAWIATSYNNQNNPQEFLAISIEEQYEYTLTLTSSPPQGGSITTQPNPPYYYNTLVTLTAVPNTGYTFDHWSGDLSGSNNPETILMDSNKAVTATFTQQNTPPDAMDDSATVQENSTDNQIAVLLNDIDPDGDTLSITTITQPLFGTSAHDGTYAYYTPNIGYDGADSFKYTITDGNGGTDTATIYLTILPLNETNNPPNQPKHPLPDDQATNISINADLAWEGGDPDDGDIVRYDVYFGPTSNPSLLQHNHTSVNYPLGTLAYNTTYYWHITAWDNHNASTPGPLWSFTTEKQEQHESSINITITKPIAHRFYYRNIIRLPRLQKTAFVYGPTTITTAVTTENTTVDHVEFYIDGKLKKTDDTEPYNYRWTQLRCFKHDITVKAYSANGDIATDEITVFKWRLHPILLLGAAYFFTKIC